MRYFYAFLIGGIIGAIFFWSAIGTFSLLLGEPVGYIVIKSLDALNLDEFGRRAKDSAIFHD